MSHVWSKDFINTLNSQSDPINSIDSFIILKMRKARYERWNTLPKSHS